MIYKSNKILAMATLAAMLFAQGAEVHAQPQIGSTLATVRERGHLLCSTGGASPGFSAFDSRGVPQGIDADICRAVAAAVFGDASRVRFVTTSSSQRVLNLQSGAVDLAAQSMTWTHTREAANGLVFASTHYYDGQGFLTRTSLGLQSARELQGATVCAPAGGRAEINAAEWARSIGLRITIILFDRTDEVIAAYGSGRCDAITNDASLLAGLRSGLQNPAEHVVLPDRISKEPLGTYVRKGDDNWLDIVRWTVQALINAEELGITRENSEQMLTSTNPLVRRLLGVAGDHGRMMGLDNRWAISAIQAVGNYGQLYDRHFGEASQTPTPRGINRLWTDGGIMYGAPVQ
ncbi:amino acid ABC transporter substrate-binding protein [Roseococcus sp.]|uniref:amino acid ABC transporter substrate-binding protein n=1 Tax=Roseococcus sp. TaxID=2109646 RepID=UPI003BAB4368